VQREPNKWFLKGSRHIWPTKQFKKSCDRAHVDHIEPWYECSCGIYALNDNPFLDDCIIDVPDSPPLLYAAVYCIGWGEVAIHEKGWRAATVSIERIILYHPPGYTYTDGGLCFEVQPDYWLPSIDAIKESLATRYDVPVDESLYQLVSLEDYVKNIEAKYPRRSLWYFYGPPIAGISTMVAGYFIAFALTDGITQASIIWSVLAVSQVIMWHRHILGLLKKVKNRFAHK